MAAALGAGLPIEEAVGNIIVDIGGGTTEVAVISLSGDVVSKSLRIAGDEMDEAIMAYVRRRHNLLIGTRMAEQIKIQAGSAVPLEEEVSTMVKGRDLVSGLPKTMEITSVQIREALAEPVGDIVEVIRDTLEETPPELAADIVERGITMTGGGSLLRGFPDLLSQETGIRVNLADDPLTSVVLGTGRAMDESDRLMPLLESSTNL
jgi:rod shape-determining protein MreB